MTRLRSGSFHTGFPVTPHSCRSEPSCSRENLRRGVASQEGAWVIEPVSLNGCHVSPPDVVEFADRLRREPPRDWRPSRAAMKTVRFVWTRFGTNVFLGRLSRQGRRLLPATLLDPDGWLARFASQPDLKKRGGLSAHRKFESEIGAASPRWIVVAT